MKKFALLFFLLFLFLYVLNIKNYNTTKAEERLLYEKEYFDCLITFKNDIDEYSFIKKVKEARINYIKLKNDKYFFDYKGNEENLKRIKETYLKELEKNKELEEYYIIKYQGLKIKAVNAILKNDFLENLDTNNLEKIMCE